MLLRSARTSASTVIERAMSAFDEQNEEMEVLNSIYPTEIKIISSAPHKFEITVRPNPGDEDNHGDTKLYISKLYMA